MTTSVKPKFSDFWISNLGYVSAEKQLLYNKNDYIIDDSGIAGKILLTNEDHGNYIKFIDGYETFDKNLKIKRLKVTGEKIYNYQKLNFSLITALARILQNTLSEFFPYVHIFNNGNLIWVRGSTLDGIVNKYTSRNFSSNTHSLFSAKLTPRYNCEIEFIEVKKRLRNSWFSRELIKAMFIDVDLNLQGDTRIKWTISDTNDYNEKHWKHMLNQYSKYSIKWNKNEKS